MALLYTAYGEERYSQGAGGEGRIKTRLGLVVLDSLWLWRPKLDP